MNAAELNEIVKDVIPTAWPEGLTYSVEEATSDSGNLEPFPMWTLDLDGVEACDEDGTPESAGEEWKGEAEGVTASIIPAYHAELMFEASMTRWLLNKTKRRLVEMDHSLSDYQVTIGYSGFNRPTLVESLAAACKAQRESEE
jgi:hypothetical protein